MESADPGEEIKDKRMRMKKYGLLSFLGKKYLTRRMLQPCSVKSSSGVVKGGEEDLKVRERSCSSVVNLDYL